MSMLKKIVAVLTVATFFVMSCVGQGGTWQPPAPSQQIPVTIENPLDELQAEMEVTTYSSNYGLGILDIYGESFELHYWNNEVDEILYITNLGTGDSLFVRGDAATWHMAFDVGGSHLDILDEAQLRALDLPSLPAHTMLIYALMAADELHTAVTGEQSEYGFWFIALVVVIAAGVVADTCAGTEQTCNGPVTVTCPDGTKVVDNCGCGDSTCNKCVPNTCADECGHYAPCPEEVEEEEEEEGPQPPQPPQPRGR